MSIEPSKEVTNKYLIVQIESKSTAKAGINLVGRKVGKGTATSRISLDLFGKGGGIKIAIKGTVIPQGKKGEKKLQQYRGSWRWAPLKIRDQHGQVQTVLVNINSLVDRLGISKKLIKQMSLESSDGTALAEALNKIRNLSYATGMDEATTIKIVDFVEKKKRERAPKVKTSPGQSITYLHQVHKIPYTVKIFPEEKISICVNTLGTGSFKEVAGAFDYDVHERQALGGLKPITRARSDEEIEEFVNEANVNLLYPNKRGLVKTHEMRWIEVERGKIKKNEPVLVQHWYAGTVQKHKVKLSDQDKLKIMQDTAIGLENLHSDDRVHRDIKPENVYIDRQGEEVVGDLGDFGLSAAKGDPRLKEFSGTAPYLSPEIWHNPQGRKTLDEWKTNDVWQLGCVWYQLLTGNEPYWVTECLDILKKEEASADSSKDSDTEVDAFHAGKQIAEMVRPGTKAEERLRRHLSEVFSDDKGPIYQLVKNMLDPDTTKRPKMNEILEAPALQLETHE
jgi:serine/threonine protein kinase